MMKNYQTVPTSTFFNFCKSVGHEYKDIRSLEMMKERTLDAYRIQVEPMRGPPMKHFIMPPHINNV
jgi:hypothetical protein